MKISRTRQSLTGLAISVAITVTLVCGVVLALAEGKTALSERMTPTVYHIPTLMPSGQPTRTATASNDPTVVTIPTGVPSAKTPTRTPTSSPTAEQEPQANSCRGQAGWQPYRIRSGDTLYGIAYQYGVSLTTLMSANCLKNGDIVASAVIYVPPVTPRSLPDGPSVGGITITPISTGTQTATDGACTDPDSVIIFPRVGAILRGHVKVTGTARVPNFSFYKIEIRQEGTGQEYANLLTGDHEVVQGTLAEFDTSAFPQGEFWLRLVVVDASSNYPERCAILVTLAH